MYPYPDSIGEEVKVLVGMLRGQTAKDVALAANAGWAVQGYLQSLSIGVPASQVSALSVDMIDDAEALSLLSKLAGNAGDVRATSVDAAVSGLADGVIAKLLLSILQKWLEKFLANGGLEKLIEKIIGLIGGGTPTTP